MIDDRVLGNRPLVELQEGHACGVRTPPVRPETIAPVDLLLIQPVEFAVENLAPAIARERALLLRREVHGVEIVRTHEGHELPVRTECRLLLDPGRRGET